MTRFIIQKYLRGNTTDGRKKAGILLGAAGIFFDVLLFGVKSFAGLLSGSVAVTADAFNNLADAGAHILALLGFTLASRKPSRRFPFGCGRLEYLSGLVIAAAILLVGGKMLLSSYGKILHPAAVDGSPTVIAILLFSIVVKGYMYRYNRCIGKRIRSAALCSVATDSICDCFATGAIILSILIQKLTEWTIDGWTGLMVAACILCAGCLSAKDSLMPLLGLAAEADTAQRLRAILKEFPDIRKAAEIAVHDYGPEHKLLTARLVGKLSTQENEHLHRRIRDDLGMDAVIEMKPDE